MVTSLPALDFRYLLLENYKKLGLNENEVIVLLMADHFIKQKNSIITADLLSLKMSLPVKEIDKLIVGLFKKGLMEFDTSGKGMRTSLKPLEDKLYKQFEMALVKERANLNSLERNEALSDLYAYFEKRLARAVTPIEKEAITNWLDDSYSPKAIKDALEDAIASGHNKGVKAIDRILRSNRARGDISKEGYTGVNDRWSKDIEKTIEIAKTKWIIDDDDEE
ncbi:MAG: DnaD domain protein [Bacilli bacterium]|nr:DnaD domain protein [Bacilli bacterium]